MSIGEALVEARHRAGLTVTQVSEQTRIRESIIRGIEQDDYAACGGDFYARGHIRAIARAVGADPIPLIQEYDAAAPPGPGGLGPVLGSTGDVRLTRPPAAGPPPRQSTAPPPGEQGGSRPGQRAAWASPGQATADRAARPPIVPRPGVQRSQPPAQPPARHVAAEEVAQEYGATGHGAVAGAPGEQFVTREYGAPGEVAAAGLDALLGPPGEPAAPRPALGERPAGPGVGERLGRLARGTRGPGPVSAAGRRAGSEFGADDETAAETTQPNLLRPAAANPPQPAAANPPGPAAANPPGPTAANPPRPAAVPAVAGATEATAKQRRQNLVALAAVAVVIVLGLVAYLVSSGSRATPRTGSTSAPGRAAHRHAGHAGRGGPHSAASSPAAPPPSTAVQVLHPASATAFGPAGPGQGDNPQQAALAIDGSMVTAWETDWYGTSHFGNLQAGTGLLLDMGRTVTITRAEITLGSDHGADLQLRAGSVPLLADLRPVAHASGAGGTVRLRLASPARARYVLVWFTNLPPDAAGTYQAKIYNVRLLGRR